MVLNLQEMNYIFTKNQFFSRAGMSPDTPSYGMSDVNPPPCLKAGSTPEKILQFLRHVQQSN